jgi:protein tyrosine phosphatase (PTP) superfamily phosphohydrolase (DUF442 family)
MKRKRLRWTLRALVVTILVPALFVAVRWGSGNYGTVVPDRIYRAAQPSASGISRSVKSHGIKTVVNLRGANPDQSWYRSEKAATLAAGATQVDFPMSSDQWLSREQVKALLDLVDTVEYPILIHCEWGAERTGLVAAFCALLRPGSTLADGRREFSPYYLFLPIKDGRVMRGHLEAYERWLAGRGETHSPDIFRVWLTRSYEPGSPSREHWPCNPYPLQIVTRPSSSESMTTWGATRCK